MGETRRLGDIEVHSDLEHERREWIVQRIAWIIMALVLACAMAGLLGAGFLSKAQIGSDGLRIEYDRFARSQGPSELRIHCKPPAGETFRLMISRPFIDHIEVEAITPEPKEQTSTREQAEFVFNRGAESEQVVVFRFQPAKFGKISGQIALHGGPAIVLKQFFWP
jgi:hypothetical protein